jgi:hypothetical protein
MAHKIFLFRFQRFIHRVCRRRCTQLKVKLEEIREEKRRKKWKKVWTVVRGGGRSSNPPTCKLCVGFWLWLIRYSDKGFFLKQFHRGYLFSEMSSSIKNVTGDRNGISQDWQDWLTSWYMRVYGKWLTSYSSGATTNKRTTEGKNDKQTKLLKTKGQASAWTDNQLRELWQWRGWYIW